MGTAKGRDNGGHGLSWADLEAELDAFEAVGRRASVWWRDDDAVTPTDALDRLLGIGATARAPLCLAVIPARADQALTDRVAGGHDVFAATHGYAHANHAGPGERKIELGGDRAIDEMRAELAAGLATCKALFGERFVPVLVPPWNRMADELLPHLSETGFRGLSMLGPRAPSGAHPKLVEVNVHVDIIDWHTRTFLGEATALERLTGHLRGRREGRVDADEPTGLLTHHLVHDEDAWAFVERLIELTQRHPATHWLSAPQAFNLAP